MSEGKCNYLMKANFIGDVRDRVMSQVKIRVQKNEVEDLMFDIFRYFDYFNHLDEYDRFVFEQRISIEDIMIPNELADFITPASVKRIAGSKICKELLVRSSYDDEDIKELGPLSINEYDNLISRFRSMFKKDSNDNMVRLSDIKLEVSLDSIINKISYDGLVRDLGEWYVPINVNTDNDFSPSYFNNTYDQMILIYLAYLKLS